MRVDRGDSCPGDWGSIVSDCPWGSFYHSAKNLQLLQLLSSSELRFLSCYEGERLVGGIAYGVQEGPYGVLINCLPYFGSHGDALIALGAPKETERRLYEALLDECKEIEALSLTVITSPFAGDDHRENVRGVLNPTFVDDRCCQMTRLPEHAGEGEGAYRDKVMAMMEGRARTAYRKASKAGLDVKTVENEEEMLLFASIHRENIEGKGGVYKTEEFFRKVYAMAQEDKNGAEMTIALDGNEIVGGAALFYHGDTVEYHSACLNSDHRSAGVLNKIIIDKMVEAGTKGYRRWNFGGTWKSQDGVYKFKQSFGAEDHRYAYFTVFFRDLERIRALTAEEIVKAYPLSYVIPFSELDGVN